MCPPPAYCLLCPMGQGAGGQAQEAARRQQVDLVMFRDLSELSQEDLDSGEIIYER